MKTNSAFPILTFHALENRSSVISFPPGAFRRGLARLRESGYATCPLLDVEACIRSGDPLPPRAVVITFDDGYRSVYEEAFPALREHGMTATLFLVTGRPGDAAARGELPPVEGRRMLSWSEIREMHAAGFEIGAHTLTHPDLTQLSPEHAEAEVRDSKAVIEDALGVAVDCFAYPHGRLDDRSRSIARRNFSCACSDRLGLVRPDSDLYALERVETYYLRRTWLFDLVPTEWLGHYLEIRGLPRRIRRLVGQVRT